MKLKILTVPVLVALTITSASAQYFNTFTALIYAGV